MFNKSNVKACLSQSFLSVSSRKKSTSSLIYDSLAPRFPDSDLPIHPAHRSPVHRMSSSRGKNDHRLAPEVVKAKQSNDSGPVGGSKDSEDPQQSAEVVHAKQSLSSGPTVVSRDYERLQAVYEVPSHRTRTPANPGPRMKQNANEEAGRPRTGSSRRRIFAVVFLATLVIAIGVGVSMGMKVGLEKWLRQKQLSD